MPLLLVFGSALLVSIVLLPQFQREEILTGLQDKMDNKKYLSCPRIILQTSILFDFDNYRLRRFMIKNDYTTFYPAYHVNPVKIFHGIILSVSGRT